MPLVTILRENPTASSESEKKYRVFLFAAAVFLGVSRIWVGGYSFGAADQSWQVPLVRSIASGHALQDYLFQPQPRLSFFFPIAGFLARFWSIETIYFAGYAAASIATAAALYLLAVRMLVSRPAALLAVLLLLVGKDTVAGAMTWDALFLPRTVAMPILIFGWWCLLEGHPVRAGFLTGAAFAMHPLTGVYGAVISFSAIVLAERETLGPLWRFAAGMFAPAAVTVAYTWGMPVAVFDAPLQWYEAMLVRNLHHLTCGSTVLLAVILVYALAATIYTGLAGGRSRLLVGATAAGAAIFAYYAVAEVAGSLIGFREKEMALLKPPIVAVLQPLRMSGLFGILLFVATAGMLWRSMQKGLVARLCAAGAMVAFFWEHYPVGALFLAGALLSQEQSWWRRALAVAAGVGAFATAALFHKTLVVLIAAVLATSFMAALASRNTRFSAAGATLLASFVLLGIVPAGWAQRAATRAFGAAAASSEHHYTTAVETAATAEPAILEASEWVAKNAAPDDVTIIPTWWESFRVFAQRPVYGTYKDGTLVFFNSGLAAEWIDRMTLLGVGMRIGQGSRQSEGDRGTYSRLSEERVLEAVRRHPAKYIVRLRDDMPAFKPAFEGKVCVIYDIAAAKETE